MSSVKVKEAERLGRAISESPEVKNYREAEKAVLNNRLTPSNNLDFPALHRCIPMFLVLVIFYFGAHVIAWVLR